MVEGKGRESWEQVTERTIAGIAELGKFTDEETAWSAKCKRLSRFCPLVAGFGQVAPNGSRTPKTSAVLTTARPPG